jgi:hypothetical protein
MGVRLAHGTSCGRRQDRSCSATVLHCAALGRPGVEGDWCGRAVLLAAHSRLAADRPCGRRPPQRRNGQASPAMSGSRRRSTKRTTAAPAAAHDRPRRAGRHADADRASLRGTMVSWHRPPAVRCWGCARATPWLAAQTCPRIGPPTDAWRVRKQDEHRREGKGDRHRLSRGERATMT